MKNPQLFLLHFAGGNCYSFQTLLPLLTGFDVVPLELPGRGLRIHETLLKDFELAAQDLYNQVLNKLSTPDFLIYGHSMGAYLALKVATMLEETKKPPVCLLVSGTPGPGVGVRKRRYQLAYDDFVAELRRLGGVPEELLADKELLSFFEPIIRADFEIVEREEIVIESVISAPIVSLMGSREEYTDEISNWKRFTRSDFSYEILEGDHFFIYKHQARIANIITHAYCKVNSRNKGYDKFRLNGSY